jgi:NAD(P)-dependent dehydrogenase (short-subunit alcohol dehydrogenase family)
MAARFDGRVIAVTGATGIAAASAKLLCSEGASVFTISRDADECAELGASIGDGGHHGWAVADLRDEPQTVAAFEACRERFGRVDGLLAVAGGSGRRFGDGPIDTITLEAWLATMDLNLTATFLPMREALKLMMPERGGSGGCIVVISSVLALHPSPALFGTHAYAAAKGAQLALVRSTAATYADRGIRVNAVAPSVVATPMSERAQGDPVVAGYVARKQPLTGGFLSASAVASASAFLLSDEADAITGQILEVDGGWSITETTP